MNATQESQGSKVHPPNSNLATVSVHGALALGRKRPETLSHSHHVVAPKRRCVYAPQKHVRFATDLNALMDLLSDDLVAFQTWDVGSGCSGGRPNNKRVRFALQLESFAAETPLLDETVETTWYTDDDYYNFKLDSRCTIMTARRKLVSTGTVSDNDDDDDDTQDTLLGLEHFLSRTLEQARADRCRRHVERILSLHQPKPPTYLSGKTFVNEDDDDDGLKKVDVTNHQLWGRSVHLL
jgi:hypothetical protein